MVLGVEADYSLAPSLEVIAEVNNALYKLAENYGDLVTIDRIAFAKSIGGVIAHEFGHAFVQTSGKRTKTHKRDLIMLKK